MQFKEIIGNEILKLRLRQMVDSGRTGHAIMLVEKDGYGGLAMAMALIQYMSCPDRKQGEDSCGVCPTCRKISALLHPDLHFAFPVNSPTGATSSKKPLSVNFMHLWRELFEANPYFTEAELYSKLGIEDKTGIISVAEAKEILESLSLRSYEGHNKYMVVWLPERMNAEASNALLKIIEEPTADTYFLFVTHAPERVISTILSRSQIIRLQPASEQELAPYLERTGGVPHAEAVVYARTSGGSPGVARAMATGSSAAAAYLQYVQEVMDGVLEKDLRSLLESSERLVGLGKERQKEFCAYAEDFLRKCMMHGKGLQQIADVLPLETEVVTKYGKVLPVSFYERAFKALESARTAMESNVNAKMNFCNLVNVLYAVYNF